MNYNYLTYILFLAFMGLLSGCGQNDQQFEQGMSEESPVTYHKSEDPEMKAAFEKAQGTFRYFWKEVSLDYNRIIPALDMASIKLAFSDDASDPDSQVEHMWVGDLSFDGETIVGTLLNSPNYLTSVTAGDEVRCGVDEISDWMITSLGTIYGGYTVQVTRSRMNESDRNAYDLAWGVDFPDPSDVNLPKDPSEFEPVIADGLRDALKEDSDYVHSKDDQGRTPLHWAALNGRLLSVNVLLEYGADSKATCDKGRTPGDYAKLMGWQEIANVLQSASD